MHNTIRSFFSVVCVIALAGAAAAGACQQPYDYPAIELDLCPGPCSGCDDDDEKYECKLWMFDADDNLLYDGNHWVGEFCAAPNQHPSEISLSHALPCLEECKAALQAQSPGGKCGLPYEIYENSEGKWAWEWRVFTGPLCDSSLNDGGTTGGGGGGGGSGETGAVCPGDSGTGAYGDEPPEYSCPEWYDPDELVASKQRPRQPIFDVNIDEGFVENLKMSNHAPIICDEGRYIEGAFQDVQAGELFYEIGFRDGDYELEVRGFTSTGPTPWYTLNTPEGVNAAVVALHEKNYLHFRFQRPGPFAPATYEVYMDMIDCSGSCPLP
jgi:hypothetical protein